MLKSIAPLFLALLALTGCNDITAPQEGEKYTVVTETANTPDVVEIFSLGCGHCRNMETLLPEIKKQAGVEISKVHVTFNQSAQVAAYIYYTAAIQTGGQPDHTLMEEMFAYVQDRSDNVTEEQRKEKLTKIFTSRELSSPFDLSEEQQKQVYKKMTDAEKLVANAQIASVPAFLVKGKYLVQSSAHESVEDMAETIRYLSTMDSK